MAGKSTPPQSPKLTGAAYVHAVVSEYIATTPIRPMHIDGAPKKKVKHAAQPTLEPEDGSDSATTIDDLNSHR